MKKRVLIAAGAVLFVCLCLLAAALYSGAFSRASELHTAVISVNGEVVRTVDLRTAPDEVFTISNGDSCNVICIRDGAIFVQDASCPDKICVQHGELKSEFLPIVCLPNKLTIELQ